ncbi:HEAT repeat domain-containing protein [Candidatus Micrarchaeota archaeon]|nr:HEAT repeat domain-containing protein [Candidatus Micrarchaeota archaeon]MBU1682298.1 HEAT repeat domain-containing protein [Candidatus Micrarchaeota archaeon]
MINSKRTLRTALAITVSVAFAQSCAMRAKEPLVDAKAQLPKPVSIAGVSNTIRSVEEKQTKSHKQRMREAIKTIRHGTDQEKSAALDELKNNANNSTIPLLLHELDDQNQSAHSIIVFVLGKLKAKSAVPKLIKLAETSEVIFESIEALEKIGDMRAIPVLSKKAIDQDPYTQALSISALGTLGAHESASLILDALKSKFEPVLLSATRAIGKLADERAIPDLMAALLHRSPDISSAARDSLGKIGKPALRPLLSALQNATINDRIYLIEAIAEIGTVGIPTLIQEIYTASPTAAYGIVVALGIIKDKSTIPTLTMALEHPEPNVRGTAANSLRIIGDKSTIPALEKVITNDSSPFAVAAARAAIESMQ